MRSKKESVYSALPIWIFTVLFVILPLAYTVFLSFMTRTDTWDVQYRFTMQNYRDLFSFPYPETFLKSLKLAAEVTLFSIALGYPAGLFIAEASPKQQKFFLTAQMIPFWINSIVRLYSIIILLRADGPLGFLKILYSYPAVVAALIYAEVPFVIYSVYSVAVKTDKSAYEAARVLGAGKMRAFLDITLPLTAKGILSGIKLSFIGAMGLFFIPNLFGGGKVLVFGNLIEDQLMKIHNLPLAAALSVFLMAVTALTVSLSNFCDPIERVRHRAHRKERVR